MSAAAAAGEKLIGGFDVDEDRRRVGLLARMFGFPTNLAGRLISATVYCTSGRRN